MPTSSWRLSTAHNVRPEHSASDTEVRISELATPEMANFLGKLFGGALLSMIDKAAYVCAARYAGTVCVTASFDRVDFHSPIEVGELVHLTAQVHHVGRTSLGIGIEVHSENVQTGEVRHTNSSYVTMVALRDGKPAPVPPLVCDTPEAKRRYLLAKYRREYRTEYSERVARREAELAAMSDEELDRLIADPRTTP